MVGSLLKKANLSTPHRPSTCAAIFFSWWRRIALAHWNRESESFGSQPVYRKLFPRGPHSSKNNFFEIKISRPTPLDSLSVLLWILSLMIFKIILMNRMLALMKVYFSRFYVEWRKWMPKNVIECWLKSKNRYWIWFMRKYSLFHANECIFALLVLLMRLRWNLGYLEKAELPY